MGHLYTFQRRWIDHWKTTLRVDIHETHAFARDFGVLNDCRVQDWVLCDREWGKMGGFLSDWLLSLVGHSITMALGFGVLWEGLIHRNDLISFFRFFYSFSFLRFSFFWSETNRFGKEDGLLCTITRRHKAAPRDGNMGIAHLQRISERSLASENRVALSCRICMVAAVNRQYTS